MVFPLRLPRSFSHSTISPSIARNSLVFGQFASFVRTSARNPHGQWSQCRRTVDGVPASLQRMSFSSQNIVRWASLAFVHSPERRSAGLDPSASLPVAKASVARFVYYWANLPWTSSAHVRQNASYLASSILAIWGNRAAPFVRATKAAWLLAWLFHQLPIRLLLRLPAPDVIGAHRAGDHHSDLLHDFRDQRVPQERTHRLARSPLPRAVSDSPFAKRELETATLKPSIITCARRRRLHTPACAPSTAATLPCA